MPHPRSVATTSTLGLWTFGLKLGWRKAQNFNPNPKVIAYKVEWPIKVRFQYINSVDLPKSQTCK